MALARIVGEAGRSLEWTRALHANCIAERGAPQTFVLLEGELPVGTATLARRDLEERPDLSPWLAGVFVVPGRRGRGYVNHLFAAFEGACRAASIQIAWLYTDTAERIYLRAGWEAAEVIRRPDERHITLMRRTVPERPSVPDRDTTGRCEEVARRPWRARPCYGCAMRRRCGRRECRNRWGRDSRHG